MKRKKCPKCGSEKFGIREHWNGMSISWQFGDNKEDGNKEHGYPAKVQGECGCGHVWTFRNITQVDDENFDLLMGYGGKI